MKTVNDIKSQFDVVCTIDLNQCESESYPWLFQKLQPWDHTEFNKNQRILMTYYGDISLDLLSHVQRIINFLDITNLFVIIATNDNNIKDKIDAVTQTVSTDPTRFEFLLLDLRDNVQPKSITKFSLPENICLAPWSRLEIKLDGTVTPCCVYKGSIVNNNDTPMKIFDHTLEEIYLSEDLIALRKQFLSGQRPTKCQQCWVDESSKIKSMREHHAWDLQSQQYNINVYKDTIENVKIVHSELGNLCNLKCRICSPTYSSKRAVEEISQLPKSQRRSSHWFNQLKQKNWVNDQSLTFWDDYLELSKNLIEISFTGGEPMLIDQQFKLVKQISNNSWAKNISLKYTSNGTVFPIEIIEHWKRFKDVSVTISLDDIEDRFEYQRSGASWNDVKQNIQNYSSLKKQMNLVTKINSTVNILNVWHLPELCLYFENIDVDFIRLNVLHFPTELSIRNLPTEAKDELKNHLTSFKYPKSVESQISGILNFINLDQIASLDAVTNNIRRLDLIRNQDFSKVSPEMAKLLNYQR